MLGLHTPQTAVLEIVDEATPRKPRLISHPLLFYKMEKM
jgi:hypothetical protein